MTRRSAHPERGFSAPVAENGSRPVITTGSHSRRETTSTKVVDGGRAVLKPSGQNMRHEAYMKKRKREEKRRMKIQRTYEKLRRSSSKEYGDDPLEQAGKEAYGYVDLVNKPSHYNQSGIECIEAIRAALGPDGFRDYCAGNVLKYVWRHKYKNGKQDIEKGTVYLNWLSEGYED